MSWYRAGTIALTNGSAAVTGTGTAFIANAQIGEGLVAPDGRIYEIIGIASDTALTITPAYLGSSASGQSYAIAPLRGRIAGLVAETSSLLASFAAVRDGIGAGLMSDGTVSLPGMRFAADQDTGLRRVGANSMSLVTSGVDRLRVFGDGTTEILNRTSISASSFFPLQLLQTSTTQFESSGVLMLGPSSLGNQGGTGISHVNLTAGATQGGLQIAQYNASGGFQRAICAYSYQAQEWDFFTNGALRFKIGSTGHLTPGADNAQNIGTGSLRFGTIFAATGTINTSDAREKTWRGGPCEAGLRAARRIIAELGFFQWNDAVAEKGENGARVHFGAQAQDVMRIMIEEGLEDEQSLDLAPDVFVAQDDRPSFRHAFLCFDTWEDVFEEEVAEVAVPAQEPSGLFDQHGNPILRTVTRLERRGTGKQVQVRHAGNRFGLRIDQLTMFLLAALAQRVAALEASQ